jgi:ribosome biogenesis GTPase A
MKPSTLDSFRTLYTDLCGLSDRILLGQRDPAALLERAAQVPRVLVVGEFNAGKSSLINSALGETLLPTGVTPTTSMITTLEHGPFRLVIKPIGQKEPLIIEPGKTGAMGYGIPEGGFNWEGYSKLLTDPANLEKFEQITLFSPLVPERLVIIDTPGINDISKSRAEIVYGLIPQADLVLFVISALKPFS